MAALVPLNNPGALSRLQDAGVEEIYVGFHDDEWDAKFGPSDLNRMSGFGLEANPFDFPQMCEQIERACEMGLRTFVCFNASAYTLEQHAYISKTYLAPIARAGAKGIIVSGQGLLADARIEGLDVVISTIAGVFNERIAAYYRDCGATRLILPRELSADEIEEIVRAVPELEYEVFMMRNGCMFSDSHCLGCHRSGRPSLCTSLRSADWRIDLAPNAVSALEEDGANAFIGQARATEWLLNTHYHRRTCGLCALWRFERLGISAYKVVGRGDDVDDLVADAELVIKNTSIACSCQTQDEYFARMELPRDPSTLCAMDGLSCYYPELRRSTTTLR